MYGLRTGDVKALVTELDPDNDVVEVNEQSLWVDQDQLHWCYIGDRTGEWDNRTTLVLHW